nr:MAG TPA: envelope glycoprotein [Caudoviricetes sp.]
MKKKRINYTKEGYSYLKCTEKDCYNWGRCSNM